MTGGITFLSSEFLSMGLGESAECVRDPSSMLFFFLNRYHVVTVDIFCECNDTFFINGFSFMHDIKNYIFPASFSAFVKFQPSDFPDLVPPLAPHSHPSTTS